ncbi:glycosyltransferase family protein [Amycolatopsis sp. CA-126428]|uniref:glycosyltransferase family protein n=1 Tax=Amycolatopsis sp. CA-126428 TaxID=2073158 RepID=UPI001E3BF6EB|nr:glycosyltransferase [Amycolatopsis sp. CA-126428]
MADPRLVLASAPGGSSFMEELLEVVADAVRSVGGRAETHLGPLPEEDDDTVFVVVPHEYLVVLPEHQRPRPDQLRRTIAFCVEHPGTRTFDTSAGLLPQFGGAVDINADSTDELVRRGHDVRRFQLGYTPLWDRWGGDPDSPRDIDVTYLGTAEQRRSALLARAARDLDGLEVRLLTPPHEPMVKPRPDFLMSRAKHEHLARSRVLLNLHREASRALEWVRVLEAACNGCVAVTEPSRDLAPFTAGQHLVVARETVVGAATAALLHERGLERSIRAEAYRFVREELDMGPSARRLLELAADLAERHPAPARSDRPPRTAPVVRPPSETPLAVDTPSWDPRFRGEASLGAEPGPDRQLAARLIVERTEAARRTDGVLSTPAALPLAPSAGNRVDDLDVLIVRRAGDPGVMALVDDLARGTAVPSRVLVCQDGTAEPAGPKPYDLLHHPIARGAGYAYNRLLAGSRADLVLVLDAGMRCSPHFVARLLAAVRGDADLAHCPVADPVAGLVGALPPEARRLARLPYLGSGYLVRRTVLDRLGGWPDDPWLEGLEHHGLWREAAARNARTVLVQQVLLSRVVPDPPARPVDLDPQRAWAATKAKR